MFLASIMVFFLLYLGVFCEVASKNPKICSNNDDCEKNECCSFGIEPTLSTTFRTIWQCNPMAKLNEPCNSLGDTHCPCEPYLKCVPSAVWFFGAGVCKDKSQ